MHFAGSEWKSLLSQALQERGFPDLELLRNFFKTPTLGRRRIFPRSEANFVWNRQQTNKPHWAFPKRRYHTHSAFRRNPLSQPNGSGFLALLFILPWPLGNVDRRPIKLAGLSGQVMETLGAVATPLLGGFSSSPEAAA